MELTLRGQLVLLLSVLALAGAPVAASAQTPTEQREAAILKSRAGQKAEAQATLRAMLASGIDDGLVAMDLATLLQQDGKPAEAVAVFEAASKADPPDYALLAATRAYRDLRRYDDAARLARDGERRFPDDPVWPLVLSLVLSDAGRTGEALAVLKTPGARRAPPVERLMAEGYAWRRAGNIAAALSAYGEAIRLSGNNPGVRQEAAGVLLDAGAPYGAAMLAGTTPSIDAAQAGAMVRWGEQTRPPEPAKRFEGTDAALARLDALLAATPPEETALRRRLRSAAADLSCSSAAARRWPFSSIRGLRSEASVMAAVASARAALAPSAGAAAAWAAASRMTLASAAAVTVAPVPASRRRRGREAGSLSMVSPCS